MEDTARIIRCERWGRFTIAEAANDQGLKGVGFARRSFKDKRNLDIGANIARGRALEALSRKENRKSISSIFMG